MLVGRSGPKGCQRPFRRTPRPTRCSQPLLVPSSRPDFPFGAPGPGRRRSPSIRAPEALARCSRLRLRLQFQRPGTETPPPGAAGVAGGGAACGPGHPGGGCRWSERCAALGPAALPPWAPPPPRPLSAPAAPLVALKRPGAGGGPRRMPLPRPPRRPLAAPRLPGRVALAPHSRQPRSPAAALKSLRAHDGTRPRWGLLGLGHSRCCL